MEKVTETMGKQVKELYTKVINLKQQLVQVKENPQVKPHEKTYSEVMKQNHLPKSQQELADGQDINREQNDKQEQVKKLFKNAANVVGLKPIDKVHVEHIKRRLTETMKDKSEDERWKAALESAVEMFLDKEMRIRGEDMTKLKIIEIFTPAREDWNVLYVEL